MGQETGIAWCDHTFNPWIGCMKVSPACDHCYAETWDQRFGGGHWGAKAPRRRTSPQNWTQVRKWNRTAISEGMRRRVFVASLADVFDNAVDPAWRADLWKLISECAGLDFLLLTKRPQNIAKMLPPDWGDGWPNVWLGTTAEDEHHYRQRWHYLAAIPAAIRFLSYEPALGSIGDLDLGRVGAPDWVICGGESGPRARQMHPDWARSPRDQCVVAGKAFFFKQWGEHDEMGNRVGKKVSGDLLDGARHHAWPDSAPTPRGGTAEDPREISPVIAPSAISEGGDGR